MFELRVSAAAYELPPLPVSPAEKAKGRSFSVDELAGFPARQG